MGFARWGLFFGFAVLALKMPFSVGITTSQDVMAINNFYLSLGSPPLLGWLPFGGDPCGEEWQGVVCDSSDITEIRLSGLNLGGTLSDTLGDLASIIVLDLSNNHIGGSIPQTLPPTLKNFSLAGNQLNGNIPFTFSFLSQLVDLSLNNNLLTGEIPDIFQQLAGLTNLDMSGNGLDGQLPPSVSSLLSLKTLHLQNNKLIGTLDVLKNLPLVDLSLNNNLLAGEIPDIFQQSTGLINLDLSGNNFTGKLPRSMSSLSSLRTLHLQNNKLSGTLDALKDLPLMNLDVENNLFSGHIPEKLLSIPNFKKDGNLFNPPPIRASPPPTIITSPPPTIITSPPPMIITSPPPVVLPPPLVWPPLSRGQPWNPSPTAPSISETHTSSTSTNFWTTQKILLTVVSVLIVLVTLVMCIALRSCCKSRQSNGVSNKHDTEACKNPINFNNFSSQPTSKMENVPREPMLKPLDGYGVPAASSNYTLLQRPLPPPPKFFKSDEAAKKGTRFPSSLSASSSVRVFTIASLQQYTDSFSEENFIGGSLLGNIYRAELPDGKLLSVKKLNTARKLRDEDFLDLVSDISKLRHVNILELLGYCNEHGQRLLVYEYSPNGSLYDALHVDHEMHKKLTWNMRISVALKASRALQYLHEVCHPPVVHRNFKSSNVLLDEKLAVRVADCGLAHLLPPRSTSRVSGYAAPEIESGSYTCQSDVYSLGVVMLELLTGRKSYDRTRARGEQTLARWAIPRLHDIDALSRMVDPSLNGAYPVKSLSRFADIISRCVQMEPGFRPPISEIVQDLLHMI